MLYYHDRNQQATHRSYHQLHPRASASFDAPTIHSPTINLKLTATTNVQKPINTFHFDIMTSLSKIYCGLAALVIANHQQHNMFVSAAALKAPEAPIPKSAKIRYLIPLKKGEAPWTSQKYALSIEYEDTDQEDLHTEKTYSQFPDLHLRLMRLLASRGTI